MGVAAVGGDIVVVVTAERKRADGDGFLSDIKVEESTDFAGAGVGLQSRLLKTADADHGAEELDLVISAQALIDG